MTSALTAPLEASSGQVIRHRLSRAGTASSTTPRPPPIKLLVEGQGLTLDRLRTALLNELDQGASGAAP
jgi:hypothetical protein